MELWEKVRRFLLFWLAVLVLLVIASLAVHGPEMASALAAGFRSGLTWLVSFGLTVWLIVMIVRSLL